MMMMRMMMMMMMMMMRMIMMMKMMMMMMMIIIMIIFVRLATLQTFQKSSSCPRNYFACTIVCLRVCYILLLFYFQL